MFKKALLLPLAAAGLGSLFLKSQQTPKRPQDTSPLKGQAVFVTGASTGIGRSIVETLAQMGMEVFATVRKEADGESLKSASNNIIPVIMDVTNHEQIQAAAQQVEAQLKGKKLLGLVNNAGVAVGGPLEMLSVNDLRWQFEVNVFGLIEVTQAFMPLMAPEGKIINMSSVGGETTQPFIGAYSASKHALEALSDALRRELLLTGSSLDVVVIQPGNINTPIWDKAEEIDLTPYENTPYFSLGEKIKSMALKEGRKGAPPEAVAEMVVGILLRPKNQSRYVVSQNWPKEVIAPRVLPPRVFDGLLKKVLT